MDLRGFLSVFLSQRRFIGYPLKCNLFCDYFPGGFIEGLGHFVSRLLIAVEDISTCCAFKNLTPHQKNPTKKTTNQK